jgi:hypothetical protein
VSSPAGVPLAQTVFQNNSGQTMRVYKLEVTGTWTLVATLNNGQSSTQLLTPANTWFRVTNLSGQCTQAFQSKTGAYFADIRCGQSASSC